MQSFLRSTAYANDDTHDVITDEFRSLKSLGIIEDFVEVDDLWLDEVGNVYAAPFYNEDVFETEGHGKHIINDSTPDMTRARLVITHDDVMAKVDPENAGGKVSKDVEPF